MIRLLQPKLLVAILVSIAFTLLIINVQKNRSDYAEDPNNLAQKYKWYLNQEGYAITTNDKYLFSPSTLSSWEQLKAINPVYAKIESTIGNDIATLLKLLDDNNIAYDVESLTESIDHFFKNNDSQDTFIYYLRVDGDSIIGGDIPICLNIDRNIIGVFINGSLNSGNENDIQDQLLIKSLTKYSAELGEPQVIYFDKVYDDYSVDYYFDHGLAFTKFDFFIFNSQPPKEDFIKEIGMQHIRNRLGTSQFELH